jgi:8-oxo-dGTP pyrophosphatase MutT (NUDIX family)
MHKKVGCFLALAAAKTGDFIFVRDCRQGLLGFVGGGSDDGENIEEAVVREASEELSLVVKIADLTLVSTRKPPENRADISPTALFHIGHSWNSGDGSREINPTDYQANEISEVVCIPWSNLIRDPESFKLLFYSGHWKMLGSLMLWLRLGTGNIIELSSLDDPWSSLM